MEYKVNDYNPNEIIKFIRDWTDLTQKEFAESLHLSKKTIEGYEYGTINYSFATFMKMCKKYELEVIVRKQK